MMMAQFLNGKADGLDLVNFGAREVYCLTATARISQSNKNRSVKKRFTIRRGNDTINRNAGHKLSS